MRCKCGNEITNVPEHLKGLANWVCKQCGTQGSSSISLNSHSTSKKEKEQ